MQLINSIRNTSKKDRMMFLGIIVIVFIVIFLMNYMTPMIADDFAYSFHYGTFDRITSIGDVISSQIEHYFRWGGRSVSHALAQIFLWLPRIVFQLLNSLVFIIVTLLLHSYVNVSNKLSIKVYVMIVALFCILNPIFGQTTLWLTGSCNYLWGIMWILLYFYPHYKYARSQLLKEEFFFNNINLYLCLPIVSVLAGWSSENASPTVLLVSIAFMIILIVQKKKIPRWMAISSALCLLGCMFLILAPGNFVRTSLYAADYRNIVLVLLERITKCTWNLTAYLKWPLIIAISGITYVGFKEESLLKIASPLMFFLLALISNYAMILSPALGERPLFPTVIFLLISLVQLYDSHIKSNALKISIMVGVVLTLTLDIIPGFTDVANLYSKYQARLRSIEEQMSHGITDIVVDYILPETKFSALYGLADIEFDPSYDLNIETKEYYGVDSIRAK